MKIFALVLGTLWSIAASASTYQYIDDKGVVHYSDKPVAGAVKIETATSKAKNDEAALETVDLPAKKNTHVLAPCVNEQVIGEENSGDGRGKARTICLDDK